MLHKFRKDPKRSFFVESRSKPARRKASDPMRERIVALRKQNLSVYEIAERLQADAHSLSV